MPVPIVYRKSTEAGMATYDYFDIASGTGIINFYLGKAGASYILSNNRFYADTIYTSASANVGAGTKILDLDFDVLINRQLTLYGNCIINVSMGGRNSSASAYTLTATAKIRKWNGVTETEIANGTSVAGSYGTGSTLTWGFLACPVVVSTPTPIKKGEYLRVTIEITTSGGDNPSTAYLGHDPMGNMGTAAFTDSDYPPISIAQIPVRIDL